MDGLKNVAAPRKEKAVGECKKEIAGCCDCVDRKDMDRCIVLIVDYCLIYSSIVLIFPPFSPPVTDQSDSCIPVTLLNGNRHPII